MGTALKRNPDVAWRVVDGQAILVHSSLGEVQVLNEVGSYIWEHLEEEPDSLVDQITDVFEIDRERATNDLRQFLADLEKTELVAR